MQLHWIVRISCDIEGCFNSEKVKINKDLPDTGPAYLELENKGWKRNARVPIKRMAILSYDEHGKPKEIGEEESYTDGDICPKCSTKLRKNDTNNQDGNRDS